MTINNNISAQQPRYKLVAQRLIDQINSGKYSPGDYLPSEAELKKLFGASRHTVREALRQLRLLGLVVARQGKGTVVLASNQGRNFTAPVGSVEELMQYASSTRLVDVHTHFDTMGDKLAQQTGFVSGQEYLYCNALRLLNSEQGEMPMATLEVYIQSSLAGVRDKIESYPFTIAHLIEQEYGLQTSELRQEARAITMDVDTAKKLLLEEGSAGLQIQRWFIGKDGETFEYSNGIYNPELHVFSTHLVLA